MDAAAGVSATDDDDFAWVCGGVVVLGAVGVVVALRDGAVGVSEAAVEAVTIKVACRTISSPRPSYPTTM